MRYKIYCIQCVLIIVLDFIGLTEVFHIEKDQHFTLNGYHQL